MQRKFAAMHLVRTTRQNARGATNSFVARETALDSYESRGYWALSRDGELYAVSLSHCWTILLSLPFLSSPIAIYQGVTHF